jgi:hypothetical protein
MEAPCYSKMSVGFQRTTRRYTPEDSTIRNNRCENLKFCIICCCFREKYLFRRALWNLYFAFFSIGCYDRFVSTRSGAHCSNIRALKPWLIMFLEGFDTRIKSSKFRSRRSRYSSQNTPWSSIPPLKLTSDKLSLSIKVTTSSMPYSQESVNGPCRDPWSRSIHFTPSYPIF